VTVAEDDLSRQIIGALIEAHKRPKPVLLESAYETCQAYEIGETGIPFVRQMPLPIAYKEVRLDA
jgi:GxxExxY protein